MEGVALREGSWTWLRELFETLATALILFALINVFTARYEVLSVSMEPTLHEGQMIIVNKAYLWFEKPERGDIVVFRPVRGDPEGIPLIKRIIGLPGDEVETREGRVWVNGMALNEPYVSGPPAYENRWVVEEGAYFVLGDNRNNSSDSHSWGTLPISHLIGKAVFRYWPPDKIGGFPTYSFSRLEATR
jgi:signal peptidase I